MSKLYLGTREVTPAIIQKRYNANIDNFLGITNASGVLNLPKGNFDLSFDGVVDLAQRALSDKFKYMKVKNVYFPDLTTISGNYALYSAFYGDSLTSVSFPKLETISGSNALTSAFEYSGIKTCTFPKLSLISGASALNRCFAYNGGLEDVYFPALKTTSFGTNVNQFVNIVSGTGTNRVHTLHFPSNLETTIQGLTGYPLFGGTSGYVILSFDLPATT